MVKPSERGHGQIDGFLGLLLGSVVFVIIHWPWFLAWVVVLTAAVVEWRLVW